MILKFKFFLFLILFVNNIFAIDVLVPKNNIAYKEKISISNLKKMKVTKVLSSCLPLTLKSIKNTVYIAKHYIKKNTVICLDDVKAYKNKSVIFNFGSIEIEKHGEIIFENNRYITIKKRNGKLEKIYKNGFDK